MLITTWNQQTVFFVLYFVGIYIAYSDEHLQEITMTLRQIRFDFFMCCFTITVNLLGKDVKVQTFKRSLNYEL